MLPSSMDETAIILLWSRSFFIAGNLTMENQTISNRYIKLADLLRFLRLQKVAKRSAGLSVKTGRSTLAEI